VETRVETQKAFEFSEYGSSLRRRRGVILAIWVPIVIVTALLAVGLPSAYVSVATFQLKTDFNNESKAEDYADHFVTGLTGAVLDSPELGSAVKTLAPYPGLDAAAALKKLKGDTSVDMITQKILDPHSGLERNINTGFAVSYANRDPQRAQQVAAWLTDAFVRDSRRAAAAQAAAESRFYAAEADLERTKITASEARLAKFKQENFDRLPDTAQANLNIKAMADQDLEGIERDLRALQQNRTFVLQQLQQARAAGANVDSLRALQDEYQKKGTVYDPNHPDMLALRQQIDAMQRGDLAAGVGSDLQSQLTAQRTALAGMRQRYSEDHPDVKRLERSIQNLQARIASGEKGDTTYAGRTPIVVQLETQLNGLDSQAAALAQHRAEVRDKLANLQGRLQSTPEVERAYETLNRDAGTARQEYDALINKRMEAEVKAASISNGTADQFTLVTAPVVPKVPTKPRRLGIALIGLIGATFLAFMAALGATALDSTVRGSRDVVALLNTTPLGIVPVIHNAAFNRQHTRRMAAIVATTIIAIPALYLLIRFMAP